MKEFSSVSPDEKRLVQSLPWCGRSWRILCLMASAGMAMMLVDGGHCWAKEASAPAAARQNADPLEEFRAADRAIINAFAAYRKAAEQNEAANAGKPSGGLSKLSFIAPMIERGDFGGVEFFSNDPSDAYFPEPPEVAKAKAEFRTAISRRQRLYTEQFPVVLNSFIDGTAKACRAQQSAQQIAATLARFPEYEELGMKVPREDPGYRRIEEQLRYLREFKVFVDAEAAGDLAALGTVAFRLELTSLSGGAPLQMKELEDYRARTMKRLREQGATELAKILKAVPSIQSEEQIKPLIAKLEKIAETEVALTARGYSGVRDERYDRALSFLKGWQKVLSMESSGLRTEAAEFLRNLKSEMNDADPQLVAFVEKRIELNSAKMPKGQQTATSGFTDKLPQRVAEISSPEALQRFSDELTSVIAEANGKSDSKVESLRSFQKELQQIGAAWRLVGTDPAAAMKAAKGTALPHPWLKLSARLRDNVMRQATVAQTGRTELQEPPLNQLALSDALQKLIVADIDRDDWSRVLNLLQAQAVILPQSSASQDVVAVKSYLTGLNFEKAELFADAAQAYRTTLRTVGQNVPAKQAAERLKAIQSKHPEAFK